MSGHFDDTDELVRCSRCCHQHRESARPWRQLDSDPHFSVTACPACGHDDYTDPADTSAPSAPIQIGPLDV